MSTTPRTHLRTRRALGLMACAAFVTNSIVIGALAQPAAADAPPHIATIPPTWASTYGWPVRPFHVQHPVRGFFGDPRIGMTPRGMTHTFHFGIDISCPNGTPVYATQNGTVSLESFRPEVVTVRSADRRVEHQYWHIQPAVRSGQRVVAYRTIVGHVEAPWGHVHFSELRDGRYVNPLRPGALGPFADQTRPVIRNLRLERAGRTLANRSLSGVVDLVVEAFDTTPVAVPAPWANRPVTPATIRWRLLLGGRTVKPWTMAVDVRMTIPSNDLYDAVYARWTRQNKAVRPGRYRFYLAQDFDASTLSSGRYVIEIEASDTRGNTTLRRLRLTTR